MALNVRIVVVTFEAQPVATEYVRRTGLPWPLLIDRERTLYHAYGMGRGSWWNILGPSSWMVYFKLLLRSGKLERPTGDTRQLGGDVTIDPKGVVRLYHVGSGPADRPPVDRILDIVRHHLS